jgi:YidC/Oxa1 family membrane protein insertase
LMDNLRVILWVLFASMVFLTWTRWQTEHALVSASTESTVSPEAGGTLPTAPQSPAASAVNPAELPEVPAGREAGTTVNAAAQVSTDSAPVIIETDVLDLRISRTGGTLVGAALKRYPKNKDVPDVPVQLLSADPANLSVLLSGIVDSARGGPTHLAQWTTTGERFVLDEAADTIEVPFTWSENGITAEKIFRLQRGRYDIGIEYRIRNDSKQTWQALSYLQVRHLFNPPERSMFDVDSYSYHGAVISDGAKYEKIDPEDLAETPVNQKLAGGWFAYIQHHFLLAAVPAPDAEYNYVASFADGIINVRSDGPVITIAPGEEALLTENLFVGPKLQSQLEELAPELPLTVDYGVLALLAQPLFWLLQQVHDIVGNWGWAIIIVTFLIKLTFYKLTEASGRSMAKMRKLQPRLQALQERYKDDRAALSQHMMDLYKREKVNPAAGCLPMLIQIPFFIAFYWVLLESVEMRQAPFALWITDLSARDPYFVLPLLMGVAMFIQQKLNPAPPDPIQAKVMTILPVMFTGFFAFFPSGLVLYWLTNSVLSVIQQWNINRKMAIA